MLFNEKAMRKIVIVVAVSASVAVFGFTSSNVKLDTGVTSISRMRSIQVQSTPTTVQEAGEAAEADATAADATAADATSAPTEALSTDTVSGATDENAVKDSAYCLKCHGPFEKLAESTQDYITEWDEKANPHVYVPHESETIVDCAECHEAHLLPFNASEYENKANVNYCYSCHHAETLATCTTCHVE